MKLFSLLVFAAAIGIALAACPTQDTLQTACSKSVDKSCCDNVKTLAATNCCQNDLGCAAYTTGLKLTCGVNGLLEAAAACATFDYASVVTNCAKPGVACCNTLVNQVRGNACCGDLCKAATSGLADKCVKLLNCISFDYTGLFKSCSDGTSKACCDALTPKLSSECCDDACQAGLTKFTSVCNAAAGVAPTCAGRATDIANKITAVSTACTGAVCSENCKSTSTGLFKDPCFQKFCGQKCNDDSWVNVIPTACKIKASLGGLSENSTFIKKIVQRVLSNTANNIIDLLDQGAKIDIPALAAGAFNGKNISAVIAKADALAARLIFQGVKGAGAASALFADIVSLVPHGLTFNETVSITIKLTKTLIEKGKRLCAARADTLDDTSDTEFVQLECPKHGLTVGADGSVTFGVKGFSAYTIVSTTDPDGSAPGFAPTLVTIGAAIVALVAAFM